MAAINQATLEAQTGVQLADGEVRRGGEFVSCPSCGWDCGEEIGTPRVPGDLLEADAPEEVPVHGWTCDRCQLVLPTDPSATWADLGPASGWAIVRAQFRDGEVRRVAVPAAVLEVAS